MKNANDFINDINLAFSNKYIRNCITNTVDHEFIIQDDINSQKPIIIVNNSIDGFHIKNYSKSLISLIAVDGCLYKSNDGERCDGVIFGLNDICFFELKFNITSDRGQRKRENFKKAISQLESTINYFKTCFVSTNKNLLEFNLEAFVCMQDTSYPRDKASRNQKKVEFLERNGIPLFDENIKEFKA